MSMKMSKQGIKLLAAMEGELLDSYKDINGVWTIGYGHTGSDVKEGMSITKRKAEQLLKQDVKSSEAAVLNLTKPTLTQWQFDALVMLVYNIGYGHFRDSTILSVINKGINNKEAIRTAWLMWDGKGEISIPGLVNRRNAELDVFFNSDYIKKY